MRAAAGVSYPSCLESSATSVWRVSRLSASIAERPAADSFCKRDNPVKILLFAPLLLSAEALLTLILILAIVGAALTFAVTCSVCDMATGDEKIRYSTLNVRVMMGSRVDLQAGGVNDRPYPPASFRFSCDCSRLFFIVVRMTRYGKIYYYGTVQPS